MQRSRAIGIVFACLGALAGATLDAMAAQVTIEGVSISLPAPAGFCELTSDNSSDRRMLGTIGDLVTTAGGNRLLAMSADCQQLTDWRAGRRLLGDYGQYQTPQGATASEETFRQTCATLRTQGDQTFAGIKADAKAKMEDSIKRLKVNEQSFAGFLGEDPRACYVAILQKMRAEDGTDVTQVTLLAITIVKDKFVFVNRYAPYVSADTINDTLAKLKLTVTALLAANPG
jgi:hypothetical protein